MKVGVSVLVLMWTRWRWRTNEEINACVIAKPAYLNFSFILAK